MITFVKLVCPSCGANLEVDSKLSQCFCQYCGTKILLHNENEQVTRVIDEAGLAKQETERMRIALEREKLEREANEKKQLDKKTIWELFGIFMFFVLIISAFTISAGFQYGLFWSKAMAMLNIAAIGLLVYGFLPFTDIIKLKKSLGVLLMFIGFVLLIISMSYLMPITD